jgi:hypothetical protein
MSSRRRVRDTSNHEYVLMLLREREASLKKVKRNYERGLTSFDEYLSCSRAVIKGIDELRSLLRTVISE